MLVLSRKQGEGIEIGDGIRVSVVSVQGGRVKIGIDAPHDVSITRSELLTAVEASAEASSNSRSNGRQPNRCAPPEKKKRNSRSVRAGGSGASLVYR